MRYVTCSTETGRRRCTDGPSWSGITTTSPGCRSDRMAATMSPACVRSFTVVQPTDEPEDERAGRAGGRSACRGVRPTPRRSGRAGRSPRRSAGEHRVGDVTGSGRDRQGQADDRCLTIDMAQSARRARAGGRRARREQPEHEQCSSTTNSTPSPVAAAGVLHFHITMVVVRTAAPTACSVRTGEHRRQPRQ